MLILKIVYIPWGVIIEEAKEILNIDIDVNLIKELQQIEENIIGALLYQRVSKLIKEAILLKETEVIIENLKGDIFIVAKFIYKESSVGFSISYREEAKNQQAQYYIKLTKEIFPDVKLKITNWRKEEGWWIIEGEYLEKESYSFLH